ncbi:MAG TPA: hypothetical protein VFD01_22880 [Candidatus Dormibacteraeota bacterium]|jgi:uncharacterized membrane protein|nr:hypothetical protein [Candidatus Dormibacteraeota bacterium]
MQNPSPGRRPGGYPDYGTHLPSSRGGGSGHPPREAPIDKRTGALLAYALMWLSGIVLLIVARQDPDVRYHSAQSTVFFGGVTALNVLVNIVGSIVHSLVWALGLLMFVVSLFTVGVWLICLYRAITGDGSRYELPFVNGIVTPYAEQLAAALE